MMDNADELFHLVLDEQYFTEHQARVLERRLFDVDSLLVEISPALSVLASSPAFRAGVQKAERLLLLPKFAGFTLNPAGPDFPVPLYAYIFVSPAHNLNCIAQPDAWGALYRSMAEADSPDHPMVGGMNIPLEVWERIVKQKARPAGPRSLWDRLFGGRGQSG